MQAYTSAVYLATTNRFVIVIVPFVITIVPYVVRTNIFLSLVMYINLPAGRQVGAYEITWN